MSSTLICQKFEPTIMWNYPAVLKPLARRNDEDDRVVDVFQVIIAGAEICNAYSELFMEIVSDAKKAADFFNGIMPDDLATAVKDAMAKNPDGISDVLKDYIATPEENKVVQMPEIPVQ